MIGHPRRAGSIGSSSRVDESRNATGFAVIAALFYAGNWLSSNFIDYDTVERNEHRGTIVILCDDCLLRFADARQTSVGENDRVAAEEGRRLIT
jgi:hypothetical protein